MDDYTREVLCRAESLRLGAYAGQALMQRSSFPWRAGLAAALAALMSLIPSVSAAASLLW